MKKDKNKYRITQGIPASRSNRFHSLLSIFFKWNLDFDKTFKFEGTRKGLCSCLSHRGFIWHYRLEMLSPVSRLEFSHHRTLFSLTSRISRSSKKDFLVTKNFVRVQSCKATLEYPKSSSLTDASCLEVEIHKDLLLIQGPQ